MNLCLRSLQVSGLIVISFFVCVEELGLHLWGSLLKDLLEKNIFNPDGHRKKGIIIQVNWIV